METAARHKKPRSVEPRLVICGDNTKSVDDTIRALIEEWLVPALVEEYIRLHHSNTDEDANPLTADLAFAYVSST